MTLFAKVFEKNTIWWNEYFFIFIGEHIRYSFIPEEKFESQNGKKDEPKDLKEHRNSALPKKDVFRPYCLPDPDIKPFNSSYNVSSFYNVILPIGCRYNC